MLTALPISTNLDG